MDRIVKSLETLKNQAASVVDEKLRGKKESSPSAKDRINACQTLVESLTQNTVKQNPDYPKIFSSSTEALFVLCDDSKADVRLVAEESLNCVFRNLQTEGSANRVHIELYREIKRNGPSRCVRAALTRFGSLCHLIRPNKWRPFATSLVPCFIFLAKRPEEAVQECLGNVIGKIFAVLGRSLSDEETKSLIKSYLSNLQLQSSVIRRTTSTFLVELCKNSRKRQMFTAYLFKAILSTLVPVQLDQSSSEVLGCLLVVRQLMPLICRICDFPETSRKRIDRGQTINVTQSSHQITLEQMLQLYEVVLFHLSSPQSTVVSASLEALCQLLNNCPKMLVSAILNPDGITESRIFTQIQYSTFGRSSRTSSFTGRSGLSSLGGSQSDLFVGDVESLPDQPAIFDVPAINENEQTTVDANDVQVETHDQNGPSAIVDRGRAYTGFEMGEIVDDDEDVEDTVDEGTVDLNKTPAPSLSLNQLESVDPYLSPEPDYSTPVLSPVSSSQEMIFPEGIGSFTDDEQSLKYCIRLLCVRFLLSGEQEMLISDKDVRVSHKSLALACVSYIITLQPTLMLLYLHKDSPAQRLTDLFHFVSHNDPQLRASTAVLCGNWLECSFATDGLSWDDVDKHTLKGSLAVLNKVLCDASSVVLKSAVEATRKCFPALLSFENGETALGLLEKILKLRNNSYFLLKITISEFLSRLELWRIRTLEIESRRSDLIQECCLEVFVTLMTDNDLRVRNSTAACFVSFVQQLDYSTSPSMTGLLKSGPCQNHSKLSVGWPAIHALTQPYLSETRKGHSNMNKVLSTVVCLLFRKTTTADSAEKMSGCISGLCELITVYPCCANPSAWLLCKTGSEISSVGQLNLLYNSLYASTVSSDLNTCQQILRLTAQIFAGQAQVTLDRSQQNKHKWASLSNPELGALAKDIFIHCLKLLNVYWHILTDQSSSTTSVLSKPLAQLPNRPSLSPVKTKISQTVNSTTVSKDPTAATQPSQNSLTGSKAKYGDFSNSVALGKIFDLLKGSYTNYKSTLENEIADRFTNLLREALNCLSVLFETATVQDVGLYAEEMLLYFKHTITILPDDSVLCVTQLLKALFGTNLAVLGGEKVDENKIFQPKIHGLMHEFVHCYGAPLSQRLVTIGHTDAMESIIKRHLGWLSNRSDKHLGNLFKNSATKSALTNYIRLFEPIVLQSLKLYTSSVGVEVQRAVLILLTQLVQDRVNYSLLDAENRFLTFLYQQLENIEEGNFRKSEALLPTLFEFLLVLSYEKSANKQIVQMPKLLQLCDSLIASGLDVPTIVMPAVHLVVLDLYFVRPHAKLETVKDILMQQEVIASMLLKHIQYPQAVELLSLVLWQARKESEQKWRKLSRDLVDRLLPILASGQLELNQGWKSLSPYLTALQLICPSAVRPADQLLSTLFQIWPGKEISSERYLPQLCSVVLCLWMLMIHCNEEAVLTRVSEVNKNQSQMEPQDFLAGLLLDVCQKSADWLMETARARDESHDLLDASKWILSCLINMSQGSYRKTSDSLSSQLLQKDQISFVTLLCRLDEGLSLHWCTLLSSMTLFSHNLWTQFGKHAKGATRKVALLLYAQCLLRRMEQDPEEVAEVVVELATDLGEICDELSVMELFWWSFTREECASSVLETIGQLIDRERKVIHGRRLLYLLSQSHSRHSSIVLPILVRTLSSPLPVLARIAGQVACRKLELLLVNRSQEILDAVPESLVKNLVLSFDSLMKDRFAQLYSLLLKLSDSWYSTVPPPSPSGEDAPELLPSGSPKKFNRLKFVRMLQNGVKTPRVYAPQALVQAMRQCSDDEMLEILGAPEIDADHLYACLKQSIMECFYKEPTEAESPDESDKHSALYGAVRVALMAKVTSVVNNKLEPPLGLSRCVCLFFEISNFHPPEVALNDSELYATVRFCINAIEHILTNGGPFCECLHVLRMCRAALSSSSVADWLTRVGGVNTQFSLLNLVLKLIIEYFDQRELQSIFDSLKIPFGSPADAKPEEVQPFLDAWRGVNALLVWLEKSMLNRYKLAKPFPKPVWNCIRDVVLTVSRLPLLSSFVRVPLAAFQFGWVPEPKWDITGTAPCLTLPTTPVHQLQNVDVLRQFVWRLCWTGWTSRHQFEEVWMALLGVLSATPVSEELQSSSCSEITERLLASSLAVRCLTALLLHSLLAPQPGNPLSSRYLLKHREKRSRFLQTKHGQRLSLLKQRITRTQLRTEHLLHLSKSSLFCQNPERANSVGQWGLGQFSIETLWSLTGILAAERSLFVPQTENPDEQAKSVFYAEAEPKLPKSTSSFVLSSNSSLDLVSCLHFLLDLFSHWLRDGADAVPLPLLSATVESMIVVSDLFTERGQFEWLRAQLRAIVQARTEDDLLLQYLIFGLLKCTAVLGVDEYEFEKEPELQQLLSMALKNPSQNQQSHPQLGVRLFTVHGLLYLLQALSADESLPLMPTVTEFVAKELDDSLASSVEGNGVNCFSRPQTQSYQLSLWALGFLIAECNQDPYSRQNFVPRFFEQCQRALGLATLGSSTWAAVLCGLESLLVTSSIDSQKRQQLSKLATACIEKSLSPDHTVIALELLLVCLYTGMETEEHRQAEPQLSAMEQLTHLFNKLSNGSYSEAAAVGQVLPWFLVDNFSPGDVMNRVVSELLAPAQAHPRALLSVVKSLFDALWEREAPLVVCDWALLSVPTFTHKTPVHWAIWSLSCFLVCAAANQWIKNLFPLLLDRINRYEQFDSDLFVFILLNLKSQFEEKTQVESLLLSLKDAAVRHPNSAFARAVEEMTKQDGNPVEFLQ